MPVIVLLGLIVSVASAIPVALQLRTQPRGFVTIFLLETLERFAFFGTRGLLIVYVTQHLLQSNEDAFAIYGAFVGLIVFGPVIGASFGSFIGAARRAVLGGALILAAGYGAIALPSAPGSATLTVNAIEYQIVSEGRITGRQLFLDGNGARRPLEVTEAGLQVIDLPADAPENVALANGEAVTTSPGGILVLALALIVLGSSLLKGNIVVLAGRLFAATDPRRNGAFSLYYYGVNLGAFSASIACAYVATEVGWSAAFGLAAIAMVAGAALFALSRVGLESSPATPQHAKKAATPAPQGAPSRVASPPPVSVSDATWLPARPILRRAISVGVLLVSFALIVVALMARSFPSLAPLVLGCAFIYCVFRWRDPDTRRLLLALVLTSVAVVFWTMFELTGQAFYQLPQANVALPNGVNAGDTQSLNALFILLLSPLCAWIWQRIDQRGGAPNDMFVFGIGLMVTSLGFLAILPGALLTDENARIPFVFLVLIYFLHASGELLIGPLGLSAMTRLAPARLTAFAVAVWFLASGVAQMVGGVVSFAATETVGGQVLDPSASLGATVSVLTRAGLWGLFSGIVVAALSFVITRALQGETPRLTLAPVQAALGRAHASLLKQMTPNPLRGAIARLALGVGGVALLGAVWVNQQPFEPPPSHAAQAVRLSADGATVVTAGAGVRIGAQAIYGHEAAIDALAINGDRLVTVDRNGLVRTTALGAATPARASALERYTEAALHRADQAWLAPLRRWLDWSSGGYTGSRDADNSHDEPRIALVIGVTEYSRGLSSNATCVDDAQSVAEALRRVGFDVRSLINPTREQLSSNVLAFSSEIDGLAYSPVAVIYFCGLGSGLNIAATDATESSTTWIPTDQFMNAFGRRADALGFLWLDADAQAEITRDNVVLTAASQPGERMVTSIGPILADELAASGSWRQMTMAVAGRVALNTNGQQSVLTAASYARSMCFSVCVDAVDAQIGPADPANQRSIPVDAPVPE
jgi:proton-dependent oligopeptide transporter, POT family